MTLYGNNFALTSSMFCLSFAFILALYGLLNVQNWSRVQPSTSLPVMLGDMTGSAIASLIFYTFAVVSLVFIWWFPGAYLNVDRLWIPQLLLWIAVLAFEVGSMNPAGTTKYWWAPLFSDQNSTVNNTLADTTWLYNKFEAWPYTSVVLAFFLVNFVLLVFVAPWFRSLKSTNLDGVKNSTDSEYRAHLYVQAAILLSFWCTIFFLGQPNIPQCFNYQLYEPVRLAMCSAIGFTVLSAAAFLVGYMAIHGSRDPITGWVVEGASLCLTGKA